MEAIAFAGVIWLITFPGLDDTQISLLYTGQSGLPFSYVYYGDINGDGYTDLLMLKIPEGSEQLKQYVNEIRKTAERATALTKQLLALGRRQVLKMIVLDLNALVSSLESLLQRLIGEDIEFSLLLEPGFFHLLVRQQHLLLQRLFRFGLGERLRARALVGEPLEPIDRVVLNHDLVEHHAAAPHTAAGRELRLEYGRLMACFGKVVTGNEVGRTRPHEGYLYS